MLYLWFYDTFLMDFFKNVDQALVVLDANRE